MDIFVSEPGILSFCVPSSIRAPRVLACVLHPPI